MPEDGARQMQILATPSQLARRGAFFRQLAQLTSSGLGVIAAFGHLSANPPARSYREPLRQTLKSLEEGFSLTESLKRSSQWLSEFDLALLEAGEHSGRIDACFSLLAGYYEERARMARQVMADLMYPLFLFHFAIFLGPFPQLFITGDVLRYAIQVFGVLLPIYFLVWLAVYAAQGRHGERWRALLEMLLHPIPILGSGRRSLALSRLAGALEALLRAGVNIIQAWDMAASASGSPALRRVIHGWRSSVEAGVTPAEALTASGTFPQLFATQYATGEISGRLDETLAQLHSYYADEGSRKIHEVARWSPRLVYLIIIFFIAFRVLSFYSGYFKQIQNLGNF